MATATEMTLALGRTVYGGDQSDEADSDEKIEGRETRLSVTWRLTDEEQDLTLIASVLAEEAERALKQADRTVRKSPSPEKSGDAERFAAERQPATGASPATGVSVEGTPAGNGNGNGHGTAPDSQPASPYPSVSPGQVTAYQNGSKAPTANSSPSYSPSSYSGPSGYKAYVPPITKPQQLAIQSHCTRHGVADWELHRLLWEMFGKKEPRELNKDQAGELLTALQRDILTNATESSAYAN